MEVIFTLEEIGVAARKILDATNANELMINAMMYDHEARLRSYEIIAEIWQDKAVKLAA